jgi:exonuclease SbcC
LRILGVYLENIRSFRRGVIVFPAQGITVIQGEVGSGKTSILMSIAYAFETPVSGRVEFAEAFATPQPKHLLRTGESRGLIRVLVRQGGRLYLLERVLERVGDKVQNTGNTIHVYELTAEQGKTSIKAVQRLRLSSSEYAEKLKSILGLVEKSGRQKPEVFTNIIYSPQFNLTRIIELDPSKRREVIEIALGLSRYTDFRSNIGKILDAFNDKITRAQVELGRMEDMLRSLDKQGLEARVKEIEAERSRVKRELEEVSSLREKLEKEFNELNGEVSKLNSAIQKKNEDILSIRKQTEEVKRRVEEVKRRVEPALSTLGVDLSQIEDQIEDLMKRVEEDIKTLQSTEDRYMDDRKSLEEKEKNVVGLIRNLEGNINVLKRELEKAELEYRDKEEIIKQGVCPVCGQRIPHEHGEKLLADLREKIESKRREIGEYEKQLEEARAEMERVREERNEHEEKWRDLRNRLDRARKIKELLIELKNWKEREKEVASSEEQIKSMEEEIERLRRDLDARLESLSEVKKKLDEAREREMNIRLRLRELEVELNILNKQLQNIAALEGRLKELRRDVSRLMTGREIARRMADIVDEISRILAQEAFRFVSTRFAELFSSLSPDNTLSIELSNDYDIIFIYNTERGRGQVLLPSGGQQSVASLALRLAVNQALRALSPRFKDSTLLLDEPTIGLSRELVGRLKSLLSELNEKQKAHIIVVTHDEELLDAGSTRIRLALRGGATTVTYEGEIDEEYMEFVQRILEKPV